MCRCGNRCSVQYNEISERNGRNTRLSGSPFSKISLLWPHSMWRLIVCCFFVCLSATLSTKSTKFVSRYLVHRLSERDTVIDRPCCTLIPRLVNFGPKRSTKIHKWVKKICNTFLVHGLVEHNEIWHDDRHMTIAGLKQFWWTCFREPAIPGGDMH